LPSRSAARRAFLAYWSLAGMLFVAVVRARRNPIGRGWLPGLGGQAGSYLLPGRCS
jgi:hypothetical protein